MCLVPGFLITTLFATLLLTPYQHAFQVTTITSWNTRSCTRRSTAGRIYQESPMTREGGQQPMGDKDAVGKAKSGQYQFGDLTRAVFRKAAGQVNQLSGKESYEFGDFTRWIDQQAKAAVNGVTGKDEYEFGDITRWVDQQAKKMACNYTSKDEYQIGDISREVIRRVWVGEYEIRDVMLALRILLSAGASLTPIASALPVSVVLELVNLGLAQDLGGRLLEILAQSLDERFKLALTGDASLTLGGITKRALIQQIIRFTGKNDYEAGDITRKILESRASGAAASEGIVLSEELAAKLFSWDSKMHENRPRM